MNFTTNRVQPEKIGEEPTDFGDFTSASVEDETPVSRNTWAVVIVAFFVMLLAAYQTLAYFFNF